MSLQAQSSVSQTTVLHLPVILAHWMIFCVQACMRLCSHRPAAGEWISKANILQPRSTPALSPLSRPTVHMTKVGTVLFLHYHEEMLAQRFAWAVREWLGCNGFNPSLHHCRGVRGTENSTHVYRRQISRRTSDCIPQKTMTGENSCFLQTIVTLLYQTHSVES